MFSFLRRFRISLRELLLVVTGVAIGCAALVAANDVVLKCVVALHLLALLIAFCAALALPAERITLLAFVGGVLIFQGHEAAIQHSIGGFANVYNLWLLTLWSEYFSHKSMTAFLGIANLELSLACGLVCAWLTRTLQRDE